LCLITGGSEISWRLLPPIVRHWILNDAEVSRWCWGVLEIGNGSFEVCPINSPHVIKIVYPVPKGKTVGDQMPRGPVIRAILGMVELGGPILIPGR